MFKVSAHIAVTGRELRIGQDEPKWQAHYRSAETDANPHRKEYLQTFGVGGSVPVAAAA